MALVISTWLWGDKYGVDDVKKLVASVRRHLKQPHRFLVFSTLYSKSFGDGIELFGIAPEDYHLLNIKGCFARLRMFDPGWQWSYDIDDRLVCMDLDTVITGPLDPLFDRPEPFVILRGANASNPCPMNGSLMMLRAGAHPEVWSDFSLDKASKVPFHEFPDDQGWIWHKIPNAAGWNVGRASGVYAFQKPGWPGRDRHGYELPVKPVAPGHPRSKEFGLYDDSLPADARMVVFPGWRSPQQFRDVPWIAKNWAA